MKTLLATICASLALGLVAAGCGGDDDDNGGDSGSAATTTEKPAETTGGGSGGAEAEASAKVSMKDIAFNPSNITVAKGGSVTWTNDDSVGHDVTKDSGPGPDFKSGDPGGIASGDAFTQKFDAPGSIKYVCTVHPGMEGTVTVTK
ncbi:MAG: cupredoxin domain-containing protein [Thermoleophilaceae bacterium]|nr:cupredoxin domain-containing protein [Thermoleophilaceae bacterium]